MVYGRLANDNEAVALKAAGVDLLSVLRPALVLGACAAAFTAYLQFDVTPQSWRGSREVLLEDPEEAIGLALKRKQTLEFKSGDTMTKLSVRDVQTVTRREESAAGGQFVTEQRLMDVVVKQRQTNSKGWEEPDVVLRAHAAVLRVDGKKVKLDAKEWVSLKAGASGQGVHSTTDQPREIDLPQLFDMDALREENKNNPAMVDWMTLPGRAEGVDLLGRAKWGADLSAKHAGYSRRLAELPDRRRLSDDEVERFKEEVGIPPAPEPADRLTQARNEQNTANTFARLDRNMRYEFHLRPAIAFGCLLFAALGCPVGLWANRADYLSIFVICFLPALLVYYPVLFMVGGYARDGKIDMGVGVWAANGVLALATVFLSWRLIRR